MKNKLGIVGLTVAAAAIVASQAGAAEAAVAYFSTTTTVSGSGTATCPAGSKVTGGGFKTIPTNVFYSTSSDEYSITGSYASSATSWTAAGTRTHGSYTQAGGWKFYNTSWYPTAVAVCVR